MRKTKMVLKIMVVLIIGILTVGCTPIENMLVNEPGSNEMVNGPLSELEYSNAKNRILNDAINDGSIILGRALDLQRGTIGIEDEIARLEDSIDKVQKNIEKLEVLVPPSAYSEQKEKALDLLNDYKESLINYYAVLETEQYELIPACTDAIKSAISSVKMEFGTI